MGHAGDITDAQPRTNDVACPEPGRHNHRVPRRSDHSVIKQKEPTRNSRALSSGKLEFVSGSQGEAGVILSTSFCASTAITIAVVATATEASVTKVINPKPGA
jgi:hypothetical protein